MSGLLIKDISCCFSGTVKFSCEFPIDLASLRIPAQCRPGSPVILGHLC